MTEWPLPGLRRVSVNCFGFGGTNAHVIMDEAPRYMSARGLKGNHNSFDPLAITKSRKVGVEQSLRSFDPQIFCYSSHEKAGISRIMNSHVPYLNLQSKVEQGEFLRHYAYTLNSRRSTLEWKCAIVAKSRDDLIEKLQNVDEAHFRRASKGKQSKICFIFCGQGAQYAKMGNDLLPFEAFRDSLEAASHHIQAVLGASFDVLEEILKHPSESRISEPQIAQPVTTALQVALVDLLDSFDINPRFVIGHSSGEVAAAYASGALSRKAAWEVAYYRGLAVSSIHSKAPELEGAMMVIGLSLTEVNAYLETSPYPFEVACINSPRSITVSGKKQCIEGVLVDLNAKNIFCRVLPVKVAYHSSHMRQVEDDYKATLGSITPREHLKTVKMFSSVTGTVVDGRSLDTSYWARNMTSPVRYVDAVQAMMELPEDELPDIIIELSPAASLKSPTVDILSSVSLKTPPSHHSVLDRKRHGALSLLETIGELWARGFPMNMDNIASRGSYQASLKCLVDLPPYPWNHTKSYWHESHLGQAVRFREFGRQDLIGAPTADAISFEPRWRGFLRIAENPWIQDHQVQKTIVYPAAGMASMAFEGASQMTKNKDDLLGYEITNMRIDKAMIIPNTAHGLEMAMNFRHVSPLSSADGIGPSYEFSIYSKQLDDAWEKHATGHIQSRYKHSQWKALFQRHKACFKSLKSTCTEPIVPRQLYELLDIVGMNYGQSFQNITEVFKGDGACISKVRVPDTKSKMPAKFEYDHLIHPATLDSVFQTLFAIDNEPMVPTFIGSLFVSANISRDIGSEFTGYSTATRTGMRHANAEIVMAQAGWEQPSVVAAGLHFTDLPPSTDGFLPNHRNLCTEIVWEEDAQFTATKDLETFVRQLAHKFPGLSILQVGGSSAVAGSLLRALGSNENQTPWLSRYSVAPVSQNEDTLETLTHIKGSSLEPFVEKRMVDGSEALPDYDLILFLNEDDMHATDLLKHLTKHGCLLRADVLGSNSSPFFHPYQDNGSRSCLRLYRQAQIQVQSQDCTPDLVILLPERPQLEAKALAQDLMAYRDGDHPCACVMVISEVMDNFTSLKGKVVLSLLDFSEDIQGAYSVFDWDEQGFNAFHAIQNTAKGIFWITRNAHMKPLNPKGAPIIALGRTLMSEDPLKTVVTFDVSDTPLNNWHMLQYIHMIFDSTFGRLSGSSHREVEYAEDQGKIYIPRLVPVQHLNKLVEDNTLDEVIDTAFYSETEQLKMKLAVPGLVDDGILFSANLVPDLGSEQVEVIFESASITYADFYTVMGKSTQTHIGLDVYGRVGNIGSDVSAVSSGERVVALNADGCFQNKAFINSRLVRKWSSHLPLSHCASAYDCLVKIGGLNSRKSVLIHAGASSFGLAAISVASMVNAKIFVTTMGTDMPRQQKYLEKLGLQNICILEAESDSFVGAICDLTNGKGVDVVYNSTQQHIEASFGCVGKRKSVSRCIRI